MSTFRFFRLFVLAAAVAVAATISQTSVGKDAEKTTAEVPQLPGPIVEKGELIFSDDSEKAKAEELLKGCTAICKVPVEAERWHSMRIEIADDQMRVSLNGEAIGFLKSPGIAHPTRGSMHFTVNGDSMLFDDVKIWAAK